MQAQVLVDEVQGAGADFVGSQKFREQLPLIAQGFSFRVANRESDSIDINVSQIRILGLLLNSLDKVTNGHIGRIELLGEDGQLFVFSVNDFYAQRKSL